MRIALLADRGDIHTVRWANGLVGRGYDIHLFSIHDGGDPLHEEVVMHRLPWAPPLGYYASGIRLHQLLEDLKPDLLHTHYASGYGVLGRMGRYSPHILSVWGQDVYEFPSRSCLHRRILQTNLKSADCVCSTSIAMARRTHEVCPGLNSICITPFGVDTDKFYPVNMRSRKGRESFITIGTVKNLEEKYGVDLLIESFSIVYKDLRVNRPSVANRLRLLIVGGGAKRKSYEQLARHLNVEDRTVFVGNVPHAQVRDYLSQIDVFVALSRYESFGVAVIEASACECPVVVSDVGGLPEVVQGGKTGFIVPSKDPGTAAQYIKKLVQDEELRSSMGIAGREFVHSTYAWDRSLDIMEEVYRFAVNHYSVSSPDGVMCI